MGRSPTGAVDQSESDSLLGTTRSYVRGGPHECCRLVAANINNTLVTNIGLNALQGVLLCRHFFNNAALCRTRS